MAQQEIAYYLENLEIFRGLKREQIERIAEIAERMLLKPGQTIIQAGEAGMAAYLIVGGKAETVPEPDEEPKAVEPGSLLGEQAMLVEHTYGVTVVCREKVRAFRITREALQAAMATSPALRDHFVSKLSSRLMRVAIELKRLDQLIAIAGEKSMTVGLQ